MAIQVLDLHSKDPSKTFTRDFNEIKHKIFMVSYFQRHS